MAEITVLDEGRTARVDGRIEDGRVVVAERSLADAIGFTAKAEGLCKDDVCIPVRDGSGLEVEAGKFDIARLATMLGRAVAIDEANAVGYIGPSAEARVAGLQSLIAPDFTLPDLDGQLHSLSDFRGKKVVLAAYASW